MHDGSEATLEQVIEFYDQGGKARRPSLAPEMKALHLTAQEKRRLVEFMKTLTSVDPAVTLPSMPR